MRTIAANPSEDVGPPSRTGQIVALLRAAMTRPRTPSGDPDAQRVLCAGMPAPHAPDLVPHLAARTRFFDQAVLDALDRGIRAVVIVGAGYDDRALRFRSRGVRYFELDHRDTQCDKRRRLDAIAADHDRPALVATDFRCDDAGAALAAAGHDPDQPSLFVCEGVLIYLDARDVVRLLDALARRAAPGSVLAVSLAVHRDGVPSSTAVQVANARRRSTSEPWRTILTRERHLDLLRESGWQPSAVRDAVELDPTTPPGRCLLVSASPAHV